MERKGHQVGPGILPDLGGATQIEENIPEMRQAEVAGVRGSSSVDLSRSR
jgi:hypothetical protein